MNPPAFLDRWKVIAAHLGRSVRWCLYQASRAADPLPVFKVGGMVRLRLRDLDGWLARERKVSVEKRRLERVRRSRAHKDANRRRRTQRD